MEKTATKLPKLTLKQRRFAEAYVLTGNATQAVVEAKYKVANRDIAASLASENLRKPQVKASVYEMLEKYAPRSARRIEKLANGARSEYVKLEANRDILDRAGYKAVEKFENTSVIIHLSPSIARKRNIDAIESTSSNTAPDTSLEIPPTTQ